MGDSLTRRPFSLAAVPALQHLVPLCSGGLQTAIFSCRTLDGALKCVVTKARSLLPHHSIR
jgi:hypothetical protein